MYKYYSTQRPIVPGSIPSGHKVESVVNFDLGRTHIEAIGREAYGFVITKEPYTPDQISEYELTEAPTNGKRI